MLPLRKIIFLIIFTLPSFGQNTLNIDSLKQVFQTAKTVNPKIESGFALINHYNRNQPDSCAIFIEQVKEIVTKSTEKKYQAKLLLAEANHFQNTGRFQESVKLNESAIALYDQLNDKQGLASAYNALGLAYKKNSGDENEIKAFSEKALEYEKKALQYYLESDDFDGLLRVYSNIGIIYRDLKQFEEAEAQYEKGIALAKESNYEGYSLGILKANLSQIYLDHYKDHYKAIALLKEALENYKKNGIRTSMEHAYRNISYNYTALGNYPKGIENAQIATQIAEEVKDPHRQIMAYSALHYAQKKAGLYKESLDNLEHLNNIEHTLLNKEKTAIIAEMAIRFETVKKEAQIQVLSKTNERNRWRIWALLTGLLASAAFAYSVFDKRRKDRLLFNAAQALEKEKRKKAELELEFKQKELTSKVLQLAHKNEFLSSLENQLADLKTNVDANVSRAGNRISSLIKRDIESDDQWEQFAQEFSSLHQGFLSRLSERYGTFTKSEVRLISLLKMNMNSKEIADIMGISDDGVKKARYRLRKKMNLEDNELQGFLLSFE